MPLFVTDATLIVTGPEADEVNDTVALTCPFASVVVVWLRKVTELAGDAVHDTAWPATGCPPVSFSVATSAVARACPGFAVWLLPLTAVRDPRATGFTEILMTPESWYSGRG